MRGRALARRAALVGAVPALAIVGLWGWLRIEDVRLRGAFEAALAEARPAGAAEAPAGEVAEEVAGGGAEEPAEEVAGGGEALRLSVLSYNVWALPVPLPGMDRRARLPRIPGALRAHDPDVVLLQEAFDVRLRAFLSEFFPDFHVDVGAACREALGPWGVRDCTGGLMTLSRFPLAGERFRVHPLGAGARWDERRGRKGFTLATLSTPWGPVDVVNLHLYAGRDAADERQRLLQLRRLRSVLEAASPPTRPVVLAGDLNVVHPALAAERGEEASAAYRYVIDSLGFVDTGPTAAASDLTYDVATNRYADLWYNRFEGRQVFDYVLTRAPERYRFEVVERRRVADREPLSDHYGVHVVVELRRVRGAR